MWVIEIFVNVLVNDCVIVIVGFVKDVEVVN